jgi:putative tricarboxylic transport membrane protein
VLAVILLLQRRGGEPMPRPRDGLRVAAIAALTIGYVNILAALGYLLATMLFLVGALLLARVRHPVALVTIPPAFTVLVYSIFHVAFEVSLPRGVLERLIT